MIDAPIVPSDARKWIGWDTLEIRATADEARRKVARG
jgi:hypothetical protein